MNSDSSENSLVGGNDVNCGGKERGPKQGNAKMVDFVEKGEQNFQKNYGRIICPEQEN
jgi:hypothetical protein